MKTVEEGFELFNRIKESKAYFEYYYVDSVGHCVFEDYDEGFKGRFERDKLSRLGVYSELEKVKSIYDFSALVARVKLEMSLEDV